MKRVLAATSAVLLLACATAAGAQDRLVEAVVFTGTHRIPDDSMRLWVQTREGDPFSREQVARDLRTILAQGYFEDVKVFTEDGPRGGLVVIFEVKEYPVILDIDYPGLKSVSESDILEEWRKRSVSVTKDAQLDPLRARRAAAVIRELLEHKGRPDAKVTVETEEISTTAVALHFRTEEGDLARVAEIDFEGNTAFSDDELRAHLKLVKEAGLVSGLTSKDIYDLAKIEYDLGNVREFYWSRGYLGVKFGDPVVTEDGRVGSGVPLVGGKDRGLKITVPVEEGRVYVVGKVEVVGATVYPDAVVKAVIGLKPGDVADYSKVRKGLYEDLAALYGERGYVDFDPVPTPELRIDPVDPSLGVVDWRFEMNEGRSYTVHRIEFAGNTFTRDNVLRREMVLNEGDTFNKRYLSLSVLRLNQLGFFHPIKESDADIRTNL
jgi:outer membrane protein insertion porin family